MASAGGDAGTAVWPWGDGLEELTPGRAAHLRMEVAMPELPLFLLYIYLIL